jgi:hypothetical protein
VHDSLFDHALGDWVGDIHEKGLTEDGYWLYQIEESHCLSADPLVVGESGEK